MRKFLLLTILLILCLQSNAQNTHLKKIIKDSLPLADTAATIETKESALENLPEISLSDNDLNAAASQNISSPLAASRDPFLSQAAFNFSIERFKLRGYDADQSGVFINGAYMNGLDNGAI